MSAEAMSPNTEDDAAQQWAQALQVARQWERLEPSNAAVKFALAKFLQVTGDKDGFYSTAREAVRLGGIAMREQIAREPVFSGLRQDPRFRELIGSGPGTATEPGTRE